MNALSIAFTASLDPLHSSVIHFNPTACKAESINVTRKAPDHGHTVIGLLSGTT